MGSAARDAAGLQGFLVGSSTRAACASSLAPSGASAAARRTLGSSSDVLPAAAAAVAATPPALHLLGTPRPAPAGHSTPGRQAGKAAELSLLDRHMAAVHASAAQLGSSAARHRTPSASTLQPAEQAAAPVYLSLFRQPDGLYGQALSSAARREDAEAPAWRAGEVPGANKPITAEGWITPVDYHDIDRRLEEMRKKSMALEAAHRTALLRGSPPAAPRGPSDFSIPSARRTSPSPPRRVPTAAAAAAGWAGAPSPVLASRHAAAQHAAGQHAAAQHAAAQHAAAQHAAAQHAAAQHVAAQHAAAQHAAAQPVLYVARAPADFSIPAMHASTAPKMAAAVAGALGGSAAGGAGWPGAAGARLGSKLDAGSKVDAAVLHDANSAPSPSARAGSSVATPRMVVGAGSEAGAHVREAHLHHHAQRLEQGSAAGVVRAAGGSVGVLNGDARTSPDGSPRPVHHIATARAPTEFSIPAVHGSAAPRAAAAAGGLGGGGAAGGAGWSGPAGSRLGSKLGAAVHDASNSAPAPSAAPASGSIAAAPVSVRTGSAATVARVTGGSAAGSAGTLDGYAATSPQGSPHYSDGTSTSFGSDSAAGSGIEALRGGLRGMGVQHPPPAPRASSPTSRRGLAMGAAAAAEDSPLSSRRTGSSSGAQPPARMPAAGSSGSMHAAADAAAQGQGALAQEESSDMQVLLRRVSELEAEVRARDLQVLQERSSSQALQRQLLAAQQEVESQRASLALARQLQARAPGGGEAGGAEVQLLLSRITELEAQIKARGVQVLEERSTFHSLQQQLAAVQQDADGQRDSLAAAREAQARAEVQRADAEAAVAALRKEVGRRRSAAAGSTEAVTRLQAVGEVQRAENEELRAEVRRLSALLDEQLARVAQLQTSLIQSQNCASSSAGALAAQLEALGAQHARQLEEAAARRAAEAAAQERRAQLAELELAAARREAEGAGAERAALGARSAELQRELVAAQRGALDAEARAEEAEARAADATARAAQLQDALAAAREEGAAAQAALGDERARAGLQLRHASAAQQSEAALTAQLKALAAQLQQLQAEAAALRMEKASWQVELDQQVAGARAAAQAALAAAEGRAAAAAAERDELAARLGRSREEVAAQARAVEEQRAAMAQLQAAYGQLQVAVREHEACIMARNKQVAELQAEGDAAGREAAQLRQQLHECKQALAAAEDRLAKAGGGRGLGGSPLREMVAALQNELYEREAALAQAQEDLGRERARSAELQRQLLQQAVEIDDTQIELSEALTTKQQLAVTQKAEAQLRRRLAELQLQLNVPRDGGGEAAAAGAQQGEQAAAEAAAATAQREAAAARDEAARLRAELARLREECEGREVEVMRLQGEVRMLQQQATDAENWLTAP